MARGPTSRWVARVRSCSLSPFEPRSATPGDDPTCGNVFGNEADPYLDRAREDLVRFYDQNGIEADVDAAHRSLLRLTEQVLSWNRRINLISRKECTAEVVYHRHILPSVALLPLILEQRRKSVNGVLPPSIDVVDIGTGGGFPGLPLALLLPDDARFTLVDSVRKKLVAVSEMAAELGVGNVRVHCGRAEEMDRGETYDVMLGRSVSALPRFCAWVSGLLKRGDDGSGEGRLLYIIGGELDELVERRMKRDVLLDELLRRPCGTSDKRALVFNAQDVEEIANKSGEKENVAKRGPGKRDRSRSDGGRRKRLAKGAWRRRRNNVKKQRGYDDFQRYG